MRSELDSTWLKACRPDQLAPGDGMVIDGPVPIAIFNVDGDFCAIADTCTHGQASLADGWVDGDLVECPVHRAQFDLRTGAAVSFPATDPVQTFEVRLRDGVLEINDRRSTGAGSEP